MCSVADQWRHFRLRLIRTECQSSVKCNSQPYEWKTHQTNFQLFHPPSILLPTNQSHFLVGYFEKFQIYTCVVSRASQRNALLIQHCYSPYGTIQLEKTNPIGPVEVSNDLNRVLHGISLYCMYCIVFDCIAWYCIASYCMALYGIAKITRCCAVNLARRRTTA